MDNFFKKHLAEIVIGVLFAIARYMQYLMKASRERKTSSTSQAGRDSVDHGDHFPIPRYKSQSLPELLDSKVERRKSIQPSLPHTSSSIRPNLMVTPTYPGIRKLILPAQEQNPYKLYQAVSPKQGHRLNYLLNKYNNARKAIIIHEILTPKS